MFLRDLQTSTSFREASEDRGNIRAETCNDLITDPVVANELCAFTPSATSRGSAVLEFDRFIDSIVSYWRDG